MRPGFLSAPLTIILFLALSGATAAQTLGGREARQRLYNPDGVRVLLYKYDFLSANDLDAIRKRAVDFPYYGAVAMSPGLPAESAIASLNYHDMEHAKSTALKECDNRRETGSQPCVVIAEIYPAGWRTPQDFQMSSAATMALLTYYSGIFTKKAIAISPETGKWALGKGRNAEKDAIAACAAQAGATDCRVVVKD